MRAIWSLTLTTSDNTVTEAATAQDGVVLTTRTAAYFQDFAGSPLEKLFELKPAWRGIASLATASDGTLVAFSIAEDPQPIGTPRADGTQVHMRHGAIYFYDLEHRREIREVSGNSLNSLAEGAIQWRSDGSGVNLHSFTYSETPGPRSAVFLDGSSALYDVQAWGYLSPSGTHMVHGITSRCMFIAGPDMYVRNLDTGKDIIEIHNNERGVYGSGLVAGRPGVSLSEPPRRSRAGLQSLRRAHPSRPGHSDGAHTSGD
jgi:hypothetical protein